MTKEKRIVLDPSRLIGFKHLAVTGKEKLDFAAAMVGNGGGGGGGKIGFSRLPSSRR